MARKYFTVPISIGFLAFLVTTVVTLGTERSTAQGRKLQHAAEHHDMKLIGQDDLQARSAYQPVIQQQGSRWIAYVGHHGGSAVNPQTGVEENNGTSIVDVTNPARPVYLRHLPGPSGAGEAGGAQMVRICSGSVLPNGVAGHFYMLRTFGNNGHQIYDVTDPANPEPVVDIVMGLNGTHKNWWECDTGIAYLVSDGRPFGWRTNRMTQVYDLKNPAVPVFIRNFGLVGQEPGSTGAVPPGVHGSISAYPMKDRVYFAYGTSSEGILQIVDRTKLLTGPAAETPDNLLFPQVGRLDMSPNWGGHTSFPLLQMSIADWAANASATDPTRTERDFVALVSESTANGCREFRHFTFFVDVTTESKPFSVSNHQVPEASGDFCARGGRFGAHSSNESFTSLFYRKLIFIAYFNAGVRAVDVRDPYNPREVAYFIPAATDNTDFRCVPPDTAPNCPRPIQTNNVEVDDRGYIYLADRANTGLHIVALTGAARKIIE